VNIPASITAGDSSTWRDGSSKDLLGNAITSADWTLAYAIRGAVNLTLTGTPYGEGWETTITVAQSTTLTAGTYYWQAYATKGSNRVTLGSGQLQVAANLSAQSAGYDGRSQAQKDLEAVQAAMRAIITGGAVQKYVIGNRELQKLPMSDLLTLESKLKADVARERRAELIANGLGNPHNLFVRF
jgi:hypothetical protein